MLRRSAEDDDPFERIIVANADQLVIVTALADPPPRPRLIDRFLVAAYDARIEPLLCLTKSDLAAPDELIATYRPLGVRYLVTGRPLERPWTSCTACSRAASACWSGTPGWASRRWSTPSCRTRRARSAA